MRERFTHRIAPMICVLILLFVTNTQAASITAYFDYWFSNGNSIAKWMYTPKVYKYGYQNNSQYPFSAAIEEAITAWKLAGIPVSDEGTVSNYNIACIGATKQQIKDIYGHDLSDYINGKTYYFVEQFCTIVYGTTTKTGYKMISKPEVFVVYNAWNRQASVDGFPYLRSTAMHELGHALGWLGHYYSSGHVMSQSSNSCIILSPNVKNHLNQYYR